MSCRLPLRLLEIRLLSGDSSLDDRPMAGADAFLLCSGVEEARGASLSASSFEFTGPGGCELAE